jgi:beta-lactamase class D
MANNQPKILFAITIAIIASCCQETRKTFSTARKTTDLKNEESCLIKEIDLQKYYTEQNLDGMFALYDPETKTCRLFNRKFYHQSITPASTFNITTALICMEEGVVENKNSKIKFDGFHKSRHPEGNKDLPIEFAFQRNIDWVFLTLRKQIGTEKLKSWITQLKFGNMELPGEFDTVRSINGKTDVFWVVPGTLRITPAQQIEYMQHLKNEELPFSKQHMQEVKQMMYLREINGYKVFGKQGSYSLQTEGKYIGWLIGWIEKNEKSYFYVNYLQTPDLKHPTIVNAQKEIPYKIFEIVDDLLTE